MGQISRETFRRRLLIVFAVSGVTAESGMAQAAPRNADTPFATAIARLSESGGFFDTDNLISNEASYLHVLPAMRRLGTEGGAYIGVGPDQNFSYIAAVRPRIAYVLDIRRDNLLQHLMFKALFTRSRNRMEYLARWLGRVPPTDLAVWDGRSIGDIVDWLDGQPANEEFVRTVQGTMVRDVERTGIPLSQQDLATLRRFHNAFVKDGLDLRFTSFNRGPRPYYPTLRQLILERDTSGRRASYLADENDWRFVKRLQVEDRIIPVVGNLAGQHALTAIGRDIVARGDKLSAFYVSNVEQYIWRDGSFPRFAETVAALPRDRSSVLIRSYFGGGYGGQAHPLARDGYFSVQLVQTLDDFASRQKQGGWTSYWELVTLGALK